MPSLPSHGSLFHSLAHRRAFHPTRSGFPSMRSTALRAILICHSRSSPSAVAVSMYNNFSADRRYDIHLAVGSTYLYLPGISLTLVCVSLGGKVMQGSEFIYRFTNLDFLFFVAENVLLSIKTCRNS